MVVPFRQLSLGQPGLRAKFINIPRDLEVFGFASNQSLHLWIASGDGIQDRDPIARPFCSLIHSTSRS